MKLQHLAVIFVLIILPISIIISSYIQNQIDAITLQTSYNSNLISATYDAIKAFQINTTNNKYSSISDSKIRDIEAAISTFYNSLNTSMSSYALSTSDLEAYTPAILFTLYDGYYIYSSYDNVYSETAEGKADINISGNNYQNGLRPYIYYSAKYQLTNGNIIVVNYTLDNAITVYGDVGNGYETRSGYLINPDDVTEVNDTSKTLKYKGVTIEPEELTEYLLTIGSDNSQTVGEYNYIMYQNDKVYQDKDSSGNNINSYFWYQNYTKTYVNSQNIIDEIEETKQYSADGNTIMSISAYDYYSEAKEFSEWVVDNLGDITQYNMLMVEDGTTPIGDGYLTENTRKCKDI